MKKKMLVSRRHPSLGVSSSFVDHFKKSSKRNGHFRKLSNSIAYDPSKALLNDPYTESVTDFYKKQAKWSAKRRNSFRLQGIEKTPGPSASNFLPPSDFGHMVEIKPKGFNTIQNKISGLTHGRRQRRKASLDTGNSQHFIG